MKQQWQHCSARHVLQELPHFTEHFFMSILSDPSALHTGALLCHETLSSLHVIYCYYVMHTYCYSGDPAYQCTLFLLDDVEWAKKTRHCRLVDDSKITWKTSHFSIIFKLPNRSINSCTFHLHFNSLQFAFFLSVQSVSLPPS